MIIEGRKKGSCVPALRSELASKYFWNSFGFESLNMPREGRESEEERKARTPYDLLRIRLEKLQENPVGALKQFSTLWGFSEQASSNSTAKRGSGPKTSTWVCEKCGWIISSSRKCWIPYLQKQSSKGDEQTRTHGKGISREETRRGVSATHWR